MLQQYDRRPFLDVLAEFIQSCPSQEDIKKFSAKYPDRWAGAIRQLATVGGFTEKRELNVNVHVTEMSDSQLEDALTKFMIENSLNLPAVEVSATKPLINNDADEAQT